MLIFSTCCAAQVKGEASTSSKPTNPSSGSSIRSKAQLAVEITQDVYRKDGLRGFYRGYAASLFTYVPSSALWWSFYHFYQGNYTLTEVGIIPKNSTVQQSYLADHLHSLFPPWFPHLGIQCSSAVLGGLTTTTLINPLDIVRARLQVTECSSSAYTFSIMSSLGVPG